MSCADRQAGSDIQEAAVLGFLAKSRDYLGRAEVVPVSEGPRPAPAALPSGMSVPLSRRARARQRARLRRLYWDLQGPD